jgi:hypothetical protein
MGEEGYENPDKPSNILVVCSWCHKKLERGTKELKREIYGELLRKGIIDKGKVEELRRFGII